jgi:RNA polymerase sigma factor (sigma-70 family)
VSPDERNELAKQALPVAYAIADAISRGRGSELVDAARDAATDAVTRAVNRYRPECGDWLSFVRVCCRREVRRDIRRAARKKAMRPKTVAFDESFEPAAREEPASDAVPSPDTMSKLPAELREAVWLVFGDGLTQREAAERLGIAPRTLRTRLRTAAEILRDK